MDKATDGVYIPMNKQTVFNICMDVFWKANQDELYHFLLNRTGDTELARDLLQELFMKARSRMDSFCDMENPKAWLFSCARNLLIDSYRLRKNFVELVDDDTDYTAPAERGAVTTLVKCLAEVLQTLPLDERELLVNCDLHRRAQKDVAMEISITLPALKSRLLRARNHLKYKMIELCRIEADEISQVCCHKKMD